MTFSMMVTSPSQSGKTEWIRKLLFSPLIQQPSKRILWCFGQWQPPHEELQKRIPYIEFVHGIQDYFHNTRFINAGKRNLIIPEDLMTVAKCEQRIADLFTKCSHHRNISVVYLTQNVFPQGKACRDIALNTQYLVLFNNPIDRQQVANLVRRVYPSSSVTFMMRFEEATSHPYCYLVVDLKSSTPEQDRLQTNIYSSLRINKPLSLQMKKMCPMWTVLAALGPSITYMNWDLPVNGESSGMSAQDLAYGIGDFKIHSGRLI